MAGGFCIESRIYSSLLTHQANFLLTRTLFFDETMETDPIVITDNRINIVTDASLCSFV